MAKLTYQQKLDALAYRFYQGAQWVPKAGDYYTTSRADLELYQVVSIDNGIVRTRFTEGSDAVSEWAEAEFLTEGFGPRRVFVPEWVINAPIWTHAEGVQHPDDLAVDRFAAAMKAKLAKKRADGRGGWEDKDQCSNAFLSELLLEHVAKGDPVDVGNLAMMVHQRGESICVLTERVAAISQLHAIVDAWEALPGGRQVKNSDVERWLAKHMGPGIDAIRGFLRRPRPDGVLPPPPQTNVAPDAAARLERILRLGRSIKWTPHGAPALDDENTAVALGELFQIFFQDAVDRALATTEGAR